MLAHPEWWPLGTMVMVKRDRDGATDYGYVGIDGDGCVVPVVQPFAWSDLKMATRYADAEAIVADGWLVD